MTWAAPHGEASFEGCTDEEESLSKRRHAVFVSDFVHIERPFPKVAAMLLDPAGEWLVAAERSAAQQHFTLLASQGRQNATSVIVPMRWEPSTCERLFPILESDIELLGLGDDHCRLSVSGRYHVPLAQLGATYDRLAVRRVAEMAVRKFLLDVADALEAG